MKANHVRWLAVQLAQQTGIYDAGGNRIASVKYIHHAHLIAAAPEMLEALRILLKNVPAAAEWANNVNTVSYTDAEWGDMMRAAEMARAAVAKATGGAE